MTRPFFPLMTETEQIILKKLENIQSDLSFLKHHIVDLDAVLTEEEKQDLERARMELKQGKTISLENLKKELGL